MDLLAKLVTLVAVAALAGCAQPALPPAALETVVPGAVGLWHQLPTPASPEGSFAVYEWQVPLDYYNKSDQFTLHVDPGTDPAVRSWAVLAFLVGDANHTYVGGVIAPDVTVSDGQRGPSMAPLFVDFGGGRPASAIFVNLPGNLLVHGMRSGPPLLPGAKLLIVTAASADRETTWTPFVRSAEEPNARLINPGDVRRMAGTPRGAAPIATGHGFGADFAGYDVTALDFAVTYESPGAAVERIGPADLHRVVTISAPATGWARATVNTGNLYGAASALQLDLAVLESRLVADPTAGLQRDNFCAFAPICTPIHTLGASVEGVGEGGSTMRVERVGAHAALLNDGGVTHVWFNATDSLGLGRFGNPATWVNGEPTQEEAR